MNNIFKDILYCRSSDDIPDMKRSCSCLFFSFFMLFSQTTEAFILLSEAAMVCGTYPCTHTTYSTIVVCIDMCLSPHLPSSKGKRKPTIGLKNGDMLFVVVTGQIQCNNRQVTLIPSISNCVLYVLIKTQ